MAGTHRGRLEGNYLKITLSSGIPIECRIYRGGPAGLVRCLRCGCFMEDVYFLDCRHALCWQCFCAHTEYVCKVDNTKTVIKQGVKPTPVFSIAVHKIVLECPECREPQTYGNIKGHLEEMHPQLFKREDQHSLPKQQEHQKSYCHDLMECHVCHEKITEESYDEHVQNHYEKVSMDNTGLNEHRDSCPESKVKCHWCGEIITAKEYDEHMDTHYGKHHGISNSAGPTVKGDLLTKGDAEKHVEKLLRELKERDERNKIRNEPPATNQTAISKPEVHLQTKAELKKSDLNTKLECPLCKGLHDRKTLAIHMAKDCPKRVVECKFCNSDVEASEEEIHEGSCRHRPGTCQYCKQEFPTIIQLEEDHQPQCPEMPVKCSFYQLGCSFPAARRDMVAHEETKKHIDLLLEHVSLLKSENESLKRTIENQEKKFNGIIDSIKESLVPWFRTLHLEITRIQ